MTPDGWCTVFSAGLDSLGGQDCTTFSPEIPTNGQNDQQKCPQQKVNALGGKKQILTGVTEAAEQLAC